MLFNIIPLNIYNMAWVIVIVRSMVKEDIFTTSYVVYVLYYV